MPLCNKSLVKYIYTDVSDMQTFTVSLTIRQITDAGKKIFISEITMSLLILYVVIALQLLDLRLSTNNASEVHLLERN